MFHKHICSKQNTAHVCGALDNNKGKQSGVLLSAHLACALLAHFASQVCTLSILWLVLFPSAQVERKIQYLHPTCALCFMHWNHTRLCCRAFYHQLLLASDLPTFVLPCCATVATCLLLHRHRCHCLCRCCCHHPPLSPTIAIRQPLSTTLPAAAVLAWE